MPSLIGNKVNQVPTNGDLGTLAFQDSNAVQITGGIIDVNAGTATVASLGASGDENTGLFFPAADTIAATTGGTERLRIDSSGNVGIGTTSQSSFLYNGVTIGGGTGNIGLTLFSSTTGIGSIAFADSTSGAARYAGHFRYLHNSNAFTFDILDTERLRIDSSGNVGIGTSSPSHQLDVQGSTTTTQIRSTSTTSTNFPRVLFNHAGNDTFAVGGGDGLRFLSSGTTERMRITSGGRLNIGTTGGSATRLEIEGGETVCAFINTSATDANYKTTMAFTDSGGTTRGTIRVNNSATQYNTSSDYRLKENIAPMSGALAKVQSLKPCTYTWKIDGHSGQGFIAHELAEIFPDAVAGEKDAVDEEGKPVYQGVDTSFLVATLTAAIQELNAKVEAQAAEIAALKNPPQPVTE